MSDLQRRLLPPSAQQVCGAKDGDVGELKQALVDGALVNFQGVDNLFGRAAIHHASARGYLEIVRILIRAGADLTLTSNYSGDAGATAVHLAAESGYSPVLRELLESGSNAEVCDDNGYKPVHRAAKRGRRTVLEVLKDHGCNLSVRGVQDKATTVHLAVCHGDVALVKWLVKNGVSPTLKDKSGSTALDYARARHNRKISSYLHKLRNVRKLRNYTFVKFSSPGENPVKKSPQEGTTTCMQNALNDRTIIDAPRNGCHENINQLETKKKSPQEGTTTCMQNALNDRTIIDAPRNGCHENINQLETKKKSPQEATTAGMPKAFLKKNDRPIIDAPRNVCHANINQLETKKKSPREATSTGMPKAFLKKNDRPIIDAPRNVCHENMNQLQTNMPDITIDKMERRSATFKMKVDEVNNGELEIRSNVRKGLQEKPKNHQMKANGCITKKMVEPEVQGTKQKEQETIKAKLSEVEVEEPQKDESKIQPQIEEFKTRNNEGSQPKRYKALESEIMMLKTEKPSTKGSEKRGPHTKGSETGEPQTEGLEMEEPCTEDSKMEEPHTEDELLCKYMRASLCRDLKTGLHAEKEEPHVEVLEAEQYTEHLKNFKLEELPNLKENPYAEYSKSEETHKYLKKENPSAEYSKSEEPDTKDSRREELLKEDSKMKEYMTEPHIGVSKIEESQTVKAKTKKWVNQIYESKIKELYVEETKTKEPNTVEFKVDEPYIEEMKTQESQRQPLIEDLRTDTPQSDLKTKESCSEESTASEGERKEAETEPRRKETKSGKRKIPVLQIDKVLTNEPQTEGLQLELHTEGAHPEDPELEIIEEVTMAEGLTEQLELKTEETQAGKPEVKEAQLKGVHKEESLIEGHLEPLSKEWLELKTKEAQTEGKHLGELQTEGTTAGQSKPQTERTQVVAQLEEEPHTERMTVRQKDSQTEEKQLKELKREETRAKAQTEELQVELHTEGPHPEESKLEIIAEVTMAGGHTEQLELKTEETHAGKPKGEEAQQKEIQKEESLIEEHLEPQSKEWLELKMKEAQTEGKHLGELQTEGTTAGQSKPQRERTQAVAQLENEPLTEGMTVRQKESQTEEKQLKELKREEMEAQAQTEELRPEETLAEYQQVDELYMVGPQSGHAQVEAQLKIGQTLEQLTKVGQVVEPQREGSEPEIQTEEVQAEEPWLPSSRTVITSVEKKQQEAREVELQSQDDVKNKKIRDLEETVNNLSQELEISSENIHRLQEQQETKIAELLNQDDIKNKIIAALEEEINKLLQELKDSAGRIIELQDNQEAKVVEMVKENNVKDQAILTFERRVDNLEKQLEEVCKAEQLQQAMVKDCEGTISMLTSLDKTKDETILQLKDDLDHLQQEIRRMEHQSANMVPRYGLPIYGYTSYITSVLQCFFNITSLREYFAQDKYKEDLNENSEHQGEVAICFAKVMSVLKYGGNTKEAMLTFKEMIEIHDEEFQGHKNKAPLDFLSLLLTWLHQDLSKIGKYFYSLKQSERKDGKKSSIISRLFHGVCERLVTCEKNNIILFRSRQPFTNLVMAITSENCSLQDLLRNHFKSKHTEWLCPACGCTHQCRQDTKLSRLPRVLIVHLYRDDNIGSENQCMFPTSLSLHDYAMSCSNSALYTLKGVCGYQGSVTEGCYTAYCQGPEDMWTHFDNEVIHQFNNQMILTESNAQILFYVADVDL